MAATDGSHQQVASSTSSVGLNSVELDYNFVDEVSDGVDYDDNPICGCIPHLWSGSIGIVDYHVNPTVMISSMVII